MYIHTYTCSHALCGFNFNQDYYSQSFPPLGCALRLDGFTAISTYIIIIYVSISSSTLSNVGEQLLRFCRRLESPSSMTPFCLLTFLKTVHLHYELLVLCIVSLYGCLTEGVYIVLIAIPQFIHTHLFTWK